ncbi:MAG: hypothetical protein ABI349_15410 [Casimicrobiaceae bacterium]
MTRMAIAPKWHRLGVGSRLCAATEKWWIGRGGRLLHVKTLGPRRVNEDYETTQRFYEALAGFPVEEFVDLWDGIPCLLLVKPLSPGATAT